MLNLTFLFQNFNYNNLYSFFDKTLFKLEHDLSVMLCRVVWWAFAHVWDELAASVFRVMKPLMMEAVGSNGKILSDCTLNIPEDNHLYARRREKVKSRVCVKSFFLGSTIASYNWFATFWKKKLYIWAKFWIFCRIKKSFFWTIVRTQLQTSV